MSSSETIDPGLAAVLSDEVPARAPRTPDFDLDVLPAPPSGWRLFIKRVDPPVQLARLGLLVAILLVWHYAVEQEWVDRIFSATPKEVLDGFVDVVSTQLFWEDFWVTLREAVLGFVIGGGLGLLVGLFVGRYERIGKIFGPFLTLANSLPKIAFAPIFLLWFGVGEMSKIVLAAVVVFFIVQVPTQAAVGLVEPDLRVVADSMNANEFQKFTKIILPGILPTVFGAFRLAAIFSLLSVVFAEILGARRGLGLRLITAKNNFNIGEMFAYTLILGLMALTLNGVIGLIERRALRWQARGGSGAVISI
ncbi:MAG TPA: ABC transporter permease [Ilumatobacteraceae bacterium]|nr:ABC transporter permease [Ilumatobacteraceae bacterium]